MREWRLQVQRMSAHGLSSCYSRQSSALLRKNAPERSVDLGGSTIVHATRDRLQPMGFAVVRPGMDLDGSSGRLMKA